MDSGLTIAFITQKGPSQDNWLAFGNQYWDDCKENASKPGYYFAYYCKKKYVWLHRIEQIVPPSEKPIEMEHWITNRNILCLSPLLKRFTWEEWINHWGEHAPYANDYHSTRTSSWSYEALQKRYPQFQMDRLIHSLVTQ